MNTREISLVAMISAIMFVFTSIAMLLPIPIGLVVVYIFRRFEYNVIRALFISNILRMIFLVFAFLNPYTMLVWVIAVMDDFILSVMIIRDSFKFKNFTVFNIGGITMIPYTILMVISGWEVLVGGSILVPAYVTAIIIGAIIYGFSGMAEFISFKVVKRILDKSIFKVEMFDKIIGGNYV